MSHKTDHLLSKCPYYVTFPYEKVFLGKNLNFKYYTMSTNIVYCLYLNAVYYLLYYKDIFQNISFLIILSMYKY